MSRRNPASDTTDAHEINGTALEHDYAEPLYGGREEIARCPDCGREVLWGDREHLTHADDCEVSE